VLRIRVELVPFGDLSAARTLEVVDVGNVGAPDGEAALDPDGERDYVVLRRLLGTESTPPDALLPDARLRHRRGDGCLVLAERALAALNEG